MVPEIRGIAKAKRTWVRESSGSREDPVPQEASTEKQFRRLASRRNGTSWRRRRDSNPRYPDYGQNGFRDRRIQPLCHPSAWGEVGGLNPDHMKTLQRWLALCSVVNLAERRGFEPRIRFWRIHDFQSCSFGQLGHLSTLAVDCPSQAQQIRSIQQRTRAHKQNICAFLTRKNPYAASSVAADSAESEPSVEAPSAAPSSAAASADASPSVPSALSAVASASPSADSSSVSYWDMSTL